MKTAADFSISLQSIAVVLSLFTLMACSSSEPSLERIRTDIQNIVAADYGPLEVTDITIEHTRRSTPEDARYWITVSVEISASGSAVADEVAFEFSQPAGTISYANHNLAFDLFFLFMDWDTPQILAFLEGDRKTTFPIFINYSFDGEHYKLKKYNYMHTDITVGDW